MKLNGNEHNGGHHAAGHTGTPEIHVSEIRSHEAGAVQAAASEAAAKKRRSRRRTGFIIGAVALAILAAAAAYAIWERPPDIAPAPAVTDSPASAAGQSGNQTPSGRPGTGGAQGGGENPAAPEDNRDAPSIPAGAARKDGVYTFLLAGVDHASSSTDTVMVVSFDTKNHTISCTSIPRDTLINISWSTTPKKLNAVYPGYRNNGRDGMEGLKTHVQNLLGFEADSYVTVYLKAVEDAVDAIGGVWFDVPEDMKYSAPDQNLYIDLKAGYQLLNGEDALKLCRFRATYAGGDIQRIGVQQDFLKALASQLLSAGSIPHLGELIDVLMNDVDTDLTAANLAWLARQFLACKPEDITFQTAPHTGSGINGISFVGLNVPEWLEMVNASINPYRDDVTAGNVNILTFNYGGAAIGATTGQIAGGYDSFYCLTCTGKNGGHSVYHAPEQHLSFETAAAAENE